MRVAAATLFAVALAVPRGEASAERATTAVWLSGAEVVRRPLSGGAAVTLATLAIDPARVLRLEVSADGGGLLVDLGGPAGWLDLGDPGAQLTWLPCRGPARFVGDGGAVACLAGGGMARFALRPRGIGGWIGGIAADAQAFAEPGGAALVAAGGHVVRRQVGVPDAVLGPAPDADLAIAPDGGRAVGRFGGAPGAVSVLEVYRLDGVAARRKLVPGQPVAWSADSVWLLVDSGAATCAVRATGGEYKCWDDYRGVGLDAEGKLALLARPGVSGGVDLFVGAVTGAQTAAPRPLVSGVAGPAALAP